MTTNARMTTYLCSDGECELEIEADSTEDAAEAYVAEGDWPIESSTYWIRVYVARAGEDEQVERFVAIHPPQPEGCDEDGWEPVGVPHGHNGAGVSIIETQNGHTRRRTTWNQDPSSGQVMDGYAYHYVEPEPEGYDDEGW
jgi:hypothetical protein